MWPSLGRLRVVLIVWPDKQLVERTKMTTDWSDLEILVAKIQAQLAPDAQVTHNVKLVGRSGIERQIDVLVRQKIGQYEMLIVLDAKDYARPVDINDVGAFHMLVKDVGAHKGALVCPRGFTSGAKSSAVGLKIDLYSPVDTDPHKWQARVSVPVVCDFRSAAISISMASSAPGPLMVPQNFLTSNAAFDKGGANLGIPFNVAASKWNVGNYPTEPGEHSKLSIFGETKTFMDNGYGGRLLVDFTATIFVERQIYFGRLPISKLSGFRDELSGAVITNAFTTGIFDPNDVVNNWQPIASEADAPAPPVLSLYGLVAWDPLVALED